MWSDLNAFDCGSGVLKGRSAELFFAEEPRMDNSVDVLAKLNILTPLKDNPRVFQINYDLDKSQRMQFLELLH